uniref:hypothetical protein n=1 Tax=Succinivibrio sp. TaxID=2053619 RepID=UPI00402A94F4
MIFKLAVSSLRFNRLISLSLIGALCSVIAPLLLLFSLRYGIISSLENNLKSSPVNLELKLKTGYKLDESFFKDLENNPKIDFVLPLTRSLSTTVDIAFNGKIKRELSAIPTKKGDPLLRASKLDDTLDATEVYLSENLAHDLGIKSGDSIKYIVSRITDGARQNSVVNFAVKGIVKKEYLSTNALIVNFDTLIYMEDFKDGYEPPVFSDGSKLNENRKFFAKARIYVKTLDDVAPVDAFLRSKNYQTFSMLSSIENLKAISSVLSFIFYAIAITSVVGGIFASAGLILTSVLRAEKSYALLLLTGIKKTNVLMMVLIENSILSSLAYALSLLLFYTGMLVFNHYFTSLLGQGSVVSTLNLIHVDAGYLSTIDVTLLITYLVCFFNVFSIKIADTLRSI